MDPALDMLAQRIANGVCDALGLAGPEILVLAIARVLPVGFFAPWIASRGLPALVRACVVAGLAIGLLSGLSAGDVALSWAGSDAGSASHHDLVLAVLHELLLGALFALGSAIPFFALAWAGELSDLWRGTKIDAVGAPQDHNNPLSQLFSLLAIALFWSAGGVTLCVEFFRIGFEHIPLGQSIDVSQVGFFMGAARLTAMALGFGLAIATPTAAAVLLYDATVAVYARASGLPPSQPNRAYRAMAGLWGTFLALTVFIGEFESIVRDGFRSALATVAALVS